MLNTYEHVRNLKRILTHVGPSLSDHALYNDEHGLDQCNVYRIDLVRIFGILDPLMKLYCPLVMIQHQSS